MQDTPDSTIERVLSDQFLRALLELRPPEQVSPFLCTLALQLARPSHQGQASSRAAALCSELLCQINPAFAKYFEAQYSRAYKRSLAQESKFQVEREEDSPSSLSCDEPHARR